MQERTAEPRPMRIVLAGPNETVRKSPDEQIDLGTYGLNREPRGFVVVLQDKTSRKSSLTHVSSCTDPEFILDELAWMGTKAGDFTINIAVGNKAPIEFFDDFVKARCEDELLMSSAERLRLMLKRESAKPNNMLSGEIISPTLDNVKFLMTGAALLKDGRISAVSPSAMLQSTNIDIHNDDPITIQDEYLTDEINYFRQCPVETGTTNIELRTRLRPYFRESLCIKPVVTYADGVWQDHRLEFSPVLQECLSSMRLSDDNIYTEIRQIVERGQCFVHPSEARAYILTLPLLIDKYQKLEASLVAGVGVDQESKSFVASVGARGVEDGSRRPHSSPREGSISPEFEGSQESKSFAENFGTRAGSRKM